MDRDDLEWFPHPVPVRVVPVTVHTTRTPVALEGMFRARDRVTLKAPASGPVERLARAVGDAAEAGEALFQVGRSAAENRRLGGDAGVHQLRAQLADREDGLSAARARGESAAHIASLERKRIAVKERLQQEMINRERYLRLEAATTVKAPFSGRVIERWVSNGSTVMQGANILELAAVDPLELVVAAPVWLTRHCRRGAEVEVRSASTVEATRGRVKAWAPTADDEVRRLFIEVENPDGLYALGQSAMAHVALGEREGLFVPAGAVQGQPDAPALHLVEHGRVRLCPVQVLGGFRSRLEVYARRLLPEQLVVLSAERALNEKSEVLIQGDH